ncbi:Uncharacterised protein [Vibrio cholerae]|nr:Uncharacterised protein [Vibrio cholerae]
MCQTLLINRIIFQLAAHKVGHKRTDHTGGEGSWDTDRQQC